MTIPGDTPLSPAFWLMAIGGGIGLVLIIRELWREAKRQMRDCEDEVAGPKACHSDTGGGKSLGDKRV